MDQECQSRPLTYSRGVTELVFLTSQNLSQHAAHDLSRTRLGKIGHNVNRLGGGERSNAFPDLQDEVLAKSIVDVVSILDRNECIDGLASELISYANDSCLGYRLVFDECSLDLGS